MASSTMTIRLDDKLKTQLENLAQSTHRSKSYLASEAIYEYVTVHEWQVEETIKGIDEANNGDFVSHDELSDQWEKKRANSLDNHGK
jgi:predicted transcriptional regulator